MELNLLQHAQKGYFLSKSNMDDTFTLAVLSYNSHVMCLVTLYSMCTCYSSGAKRLTVFDYLVVYGHIYKGNQLKKARSSILSLCVDEASSPCVCGIIFVQVVSN